MTQPYQPPDETSKMDEIIATATPADEDLEDKLARLEAMVLARREDPALKREYEALRDELAALLKEHGPRFLIGADGTKEYAYPVAPEIIVPDLGVLAGMAKRGEIDDETWESIAPRKVDKDALRSAIAAKRLTNAQVVAAVKFKPGTAYVKFAKPEGHDDA